MIKQQKKKKSNLKMSRGYEQTFFQNYINGQQVHQKVFNMTIRETQIKIIVRYHLIPKMAFSKRQEISKSGKDLEKTVHNWWEC